MRSDKRIKSMRIIAIINQKGRGGKTTYKRLTNTTNSTHKKITKIFSPEKTK